MNPEQTPPPANDDGTVQPTQKPDVTPVQAPSTDTPSVPPGFVASLQQPAVTSVTEPLSSEPKKKKLPGRKLFAVLAAMVVLGLGSGVFAYVRIMNNSPEKVLADALTNTMADILDRKPVSVIGTLKYESKESNNPYSVSLDLDTKQIDNNGQVRAELHVEAGEKFDVSVTANVITQGTDAVYVKLENLQETVDDVAVLSPFTADIAETAKPLIQKIDNKWIKFDEKSLVDTGWTTEKDKLDACTEELEKLRISDADKTQLKEIFKNNQFAIVSEELPAEEIDGEGSFHYKLDLNQEAGRRFAKDFIELESFAAVKKECELESEDIDESFDELKEQKDQEVEAQPMFELWVSKGSRRPTKVRVTLDDKEFSMENISTIKIDADDITVDIPTDFMTLQELNDEIEKTFSTGGTLGWSDIREDITQR